VQTGDSSVKKESGPFRGKIVYHVRLYNVFLEEIKRCFSVLVLRRGKCSYFQAIVWQVKK